MTGQKESRTIQYHACPETVNFVHFGTARERVLAALTAMPAISTKEDLCLDLRRHGVCGRDIDELIRGYGSPYRPRLDWDTFHGDLVHGETLKEYFETLEVRGFSYRVSEPIDFTWRLRPSVNFRFAIMSDRRLYYPPRVHRYLPRFGRSHCTEDRYPAIAFALGTGIGQDLYVFVLQSDLAFRGPAYVREHFRGWRKVLFAEVLRSSLGRFARVFLCMSTSLLTTCHPDYSPPRRVPRVWESIYEGTAQFFGMKPERVAHRRNIQVLAELPRHYAGEFHALTLTTGLEWMRKGEGRKR